MLITNETPEYRVHDADGNTIGYVVSFDTETNEIELAIPAFPKEEDGMAVVMIDGSKGIDIGTEQVLSEIEDLNIPTILFLNKMDKENVKFESLVEKLKGSLGNKAVPFLWPIVKDEKFQGYVDLVDMKTRVLEN